MSQSDAILEYLEKGHRITPIEALERFGCFRLGARCFELKREGRPIESCIIELPNGKRVKQYWLSQGPVSDSPRETPVPVDCGGRSAGQALFDMNSLDIKKL